MIIGIVAISKNYAIGKDGKLPWHYSADLKFFKEMTTGNAVVMGANTWRSIGRPLPNRLNIVLSRSGNVEIPPDVMRFASKDAVIAFARDFDNDIYIIGGAKTYSDFADVINRWIVTFVPIEVEDADIFMPHGFLDNFIEIENHDLGDDLHVKILQRK
ncbi:MAG: dihydrofolate reductase [Pyrinomonadaceae bacterium]|nr:dihydrofolate reductase [Acidobacteriota bacterium]MBK7932979.1 dihydrofolate reductase [Acidobacteriota bacterium]MBP7376131.1 dihydrofolate reductase [Pyrinomonadaceae bacterium]